MEILDKIWEQYCIKMRTKEFNRKPDFVLISRDKYYELILSEREQSIPGLNLNQKLKAHGMLLYNSENLNDDEIKFGFD